MTDLDTLERRLREGLHEMADDYDPARLQPLALWERGQTPRERVWRPDVIAAAVILVALLLSAVVLARPGHLVAPADVPKGGALPSEVWVPDGFEVESREAPDLTTVGKTSVVTLLDEGVALLVSAEGGEHRLRTLPALDSRLVGSSGAPAGAAGMSLSPDGTKLAWTYRVDDPDDRSAIETGLRVHDLLTGERVQVELVSEPGLPVGIAALQWSGNSQYVAWAGQEFRPAEGVTGAPFLAGVVDADSGELQTWELPSNEFVTVVSARDDGWLVVADQTTLWDSQDRRSDRLLTRAEGKPLPDWVENYDGRAAPVSPSGVLAVGALDESEESATADLDLTADTFDRVTRSWRFKQPGSISPVGWTPDGSLLATGQLLDAEVRRSPGAGEDDVLVTQLRGGNSVRTLGVAADLGDATPVDFAPPAWGPQVSPWVLGGLLAAALAVGLWIVWRLRRSRDDSASRSGARAAIASWMTPMVRGALRAVVLAVVLGVATQPLWSSLGPATTSKEAVLPLRAYTPPGHVNESYPSDHPTLSEAPTGPASLAFAAESDRIVLVDPHDGAHHMRRLPGLDSFGGMLEAEPTLSPDGTRLAWVWETDPDFGDEAPLPDEGTGIAVVDLTSGDVESLMLAASPEAEFSISDLVWSPDGTHLGWTALPNAGRRNADLVVGLTPSGTLTDKVVEVDGLPPFGVGFAVGNDGRGHLLSGRRLWTIDSTGVTGVRTVTGRRLPWSSAALSPDGSTLAVGVNSSDEIDPGVTGLRTVDLDDADSRMVLHPWSRPIDGDRVDVLGHTPTGRPVVVHADSSPALDGLDDGGVELFVLDTDVGEARTKVDGVDFNAQLSVATAFADPAAVSFAEPRWPLSDVRKVVIGVLGVALAAQLVQLLRGWLRRRRVHARA